MAFIRNASAFSVSPFHPFSPVPMSYRTSTSTSTSILKSKSLQELEAPLYSEQLSNIIQRDGVLRIDSALSPDLAEALLYYVEDQKIMAWFAGMEGEELAAKREFYGGGKLKGKENNSHKNDDKNNPQMYDTSLQLSLLRGGFAGDLAKNVSDTERHILADVLQDILGKNGTLSSLCHDLVSSDGELYEMAALITEPRDTDNDNDDQWGRAHSILPSQNIPPLYTILIALQDINENMGPITFFMNTHTLSSEDRSKFNSDDCFYKRTSTLKRGDALIFDSRILLSYNANDATKGSTSTMLNVSFRNPLVKADLEFDGSLRPGYRKVVSLADLSKALNAYDHGDENSFERYGDGIVTPFYNTDSSNE